MFHFHYKYFKNSLFHSKRDPFHFKLLLLNFENKQYLMIPPREYFIVPLLINTNFKNINNSNKYETLLEDSTNLYEKLKFFIYRYHQIRFQEDYIKNNYIKHLIKSFVFLLKKLMLFP